MHIPAALRRIAPHREDARKVIHLAYPVILGMTSFTLLSLVDTAMLGRLGAPQLAASGIAGVLFFAVVFTLAGIGIGVQTLTARRFGEQLEAECGRVVDSGLFLALALGLPITVAAPWIARFCAPILSQDAEVVLLGEIYLQYRFYGATFMLANWVLQGFFAGIGQTRHQMVASILATGTNILLDYALIFGRWGLPAMGVRGAALASTIAIGVGLAYLVVVALAPKHRTRFAVLRRPISVTHWTRPILRLSLPVMGQRAISNGSWFAFFSVVARIGTIELAATNVIRSVYHVTIMLGVGMGTAAAALVGHGLGATAPDRAERLGWEATKLAAAAMGLIGIFFAAAPGLILRIYTNDPAVIAAGRLPLLVLGFVQAFAGIAIVLSHALQGAGNTRFVMFAELAVCATLYLPIVYVLGLRTPLGLVGAWTGEYLYWGALAAIMSWKFARGGWKQIVI